MAELDYAFLANYARVEGELGLTAVGASYTYVRTSAFPAAHLLSVAGRLRTPETEPGADLRITIQDAEATFKLILDTRVMATGTTVRPYNGKLGLLFAVNTTMPLPHPGLYEVFLDINEERVRRLAFEAELAEPS